MHSTLRAHTSVSPFQSRFAIVSKVSRFDFYLLLRPRISSLPIISFRTKAPGIRGDFDFFLELPLDERLRYLMG